VHVFLQEHLDRRDDQGKRLIVGNGHKPTRRIVTGAGALEVREPRVWDRVTVRLLSLSQPLQSRSCLVSQERARCSPAKTV
jgi:hypothetical protein